MRYNPVTGEFEDDVVTADSGGIAGFNERTGQWDDSAIGRTAARRTAPPRQSTPPRPRPRFTYPSADASRSATAPSQRQERSFGQSVAENGRKIARFTEKFRSVMYYVFLVSYWLIVGFLITSLISENLIGGIIIGGLLAIVCYIFSRPLAHAAAFIVSIPLYILRFFFLNTFTIVLLIATVYFSIYFAIK